MFNTLIGKFGGFAGGSNIYLGTKKITANTSITFPDDVGFAVVKLFGGRGNSPIGRGGYTAIKLGSSSASQTYYITTDGEVTNGTYVNPDGSGSPTGGEDYAIRGGGFVSISTGPMGPAVPSIPTKQGTILALAGGGGSMQHQSAPEGGYGGSAGYPAGQPGYDWSNSSAPGGLGGGATPGPSPTNVGLTPPHSGQPGTQSTGSALDGEMGTSSPSPNAGYGGGGGAGYIGGGKGFATPSGGGRGGGGGGGSNYYVPSSNNHISSIAANSVFSYPLGYDSSDPDYDTDLVGDGATGSTGYAVIKFFTNDAPDYDSGNYPSSQPTTPNGF